MQIKFLKT